MKTLKQKNRQIVSVLKKNKHILSRTKTKTNTPIKPDSPQDTTPGIPATNPTQIEAQEETQEVQKKEITPKKEGNLSEKYFELNEKVKCQASLTEAHSTLGLITLITLIVIYIYRTCNSSDLYIYIYIYIYAYIPMYPLL